jgi:hypothetical protein
VAARAVDVELVDLRVPVPDGTADAGAVELDPALRAGQGILEALQVVLPLADEKVEVALTVGQGRQLGRGFRRRVGGGLDGCAAGGEEREKHQEGGAVALSGASCHEDLPFSGYERAARKLRRAAH